MTEEALPAPNLPEADLKSMRWWRKRCNRLFFFSKVVLSTAWPDKFHDFGRLQGQMCEFLEPQFNPDKKKLISVYRESLKTTVLLGFSLWLFCWYWVKKEPMSINYNTATKPNAGNFMDNFRFALLNCPLLQAIFDLPTDRDAYSNFTKERVTLGHVTFTVSSFEEQQASRHSKIIINDDLVNEQNHQTETMREQVKNKWRFQKSVVSQIKATDVSYEIDCGTPYDRRDLMWWLMTENKTYTKFIRGCLVGWPNLSIIDVLNRSKPLTDPDLMTYEKLEEKLDEQGKRIMASQYLLITLTEDEALAEDHHIQYWKFLPEVTWRTMVVDAGGSDSQVHDATGVTVLDCDPDGTLYEVHAKEYFVGPIDLMRLLDSLIEEFKPDDARVEKEKYANTIADFFEKDFPARNISFVKHAGRRKEDRIWRLRPWIHKGRILFNPKRSKLVDYVLAYPQVELDDLLDSLAYHLDIIRVPKKTAKPREIPTAPGFDDEYEDYLKGKRMQQRREAEFYEKSY